jgi:anion-transporting  ArsA/GET3 family ATPase
MQPVDFLRASRVVIVAGKGGVGKTTVTAALARLAASEGMDTLIVEVEGKSGLAALYGRPPLDYEESILLPRAGGEGEVRGRTLTPDDALLEYLDDHGMRRVSKRLVSSGALDVVSTAVPGIKDILILGKVKQLEAKKVADLIVLDAPAAGHAITFLLAARALLDSVKVGPINTQAQEVVELLGDPARAQVMLVTLPEETPVNELVETAFHLEDRVGVSLGPVVVNGMYPVLDGLEVDPAQAAADAGTTLRDGEASALKAAAEFRLQRTALQDDQLARLADKLPLPQLRLPFLFRSDLGPDDLRLLASLLRADVEALP